MSEVRFRVEASEASEDPTHSLKFWLRKPVRCLDLCGPSREVAALT